MKRYLTTCPKKRQRYRNVLLTEWFVSNKPCQNMRNFSENARFPRAHNTRSVSRSVSHGRVLGRRRGAGRCSPPQKSNSEAGLAGRGCWLTPRLELCRLGVEAVGRLRVEAGAKKLKLQKNAPKLPIIQKSSFCPKFCPHQSFRMLCMVKHRHS